MEGRASEGAVLLFHHDDIDRAAEGCRVDAVPGGRNAGAEATNVVHGCVVLMRTDLLVNEWKGDISRSGSGECRCVGNRTSSGVKQAGGEGDV